MTVDLTPDRTRSDIPLNLNQNSSLELYMKMRHSRTSVQLFKVVPGVFLQVVGQPTAPAVTLIQRKPSNYVALSVFTLLCCCWLFGIVALIYAMQVAIYTLLAWQDILTVFCVMYSVCITQHEHLNIPHSFQLW